MVKFFEKNSKTPHQKLCFGAGLVQHRAPLWCWVLSQSPFQTQKIGKILAKEFLKTFTKTALVLGLIGDLGGGKTTFLQGFAKGLGIKEKILSPSFVIFRKFKVKNLKPSTRTELGAGPVPHRNEVSGAGFKVFYHIDCYRISKPKEILNLGFKEIISNPQNIVAIEWADRIKKILPKGTLILKFNFINRNQREIEILS